MVDFASTVEWTFTPRRERNKLKHPEKTPDGQSEKWYHTSEVKTDHSLQGSNPHHLTVVINPTHQL